MKRGLARKTYLSKIFQNCRNPDATMPQGYNKTRNISFAADLWAAIISCWKSDVAINLYQIVSVKKFDLNQIQTIKS